MSRRAAGDGSIYRRKDGRWTASLQYRDGRGQTRRAYVYGRTQREVRHKLQQLRNDAQRARPLTDGNVTVEVLLNSWLEQDVRRRCSPLTYKSYASNARQHLIPALGRIPVNALTPGEVEALLAGCQDGGLSPRTVEHIRATLRRALSRAERWGLVSRNVAKLVDPPRQERREVKVPSPARLHEILAALSDERLWCAYVLAVTLGLRSGELRGLRWDDVDLETPCLHVRQSIQRVDSRLTAMPLKTDRSRRTLPLPGVAQEALERHRERQAFEREWAGAKWREHGLVFTTTIGTPLDSSNLVHAFKASLQSHGFEPLTIHQLRHACASYLVSAGVDLRIVMGILGHSQISLTANLYSHVMPAATAAALAQMDTLFGDSMFASE